MIKKDTFMYDEDRDRIMIFNKLKDGEKVYGSTSILNLIVDFTTNNKIANVEIKNVSKYLESIGVNPSILNDLSSAQINLQQMRGGFLLNILLKTNKYVKNIPFNLPTEEEILITV